MQLVFEARPTARGSLADALVKPESTLHPTTSATVPRMRLEASGPRITAPQMPNRNASPEAKADELPMRIKSAVAPIAETPKSAKHTQAKQQELQMRITGTQQTEDDLELPRIVDRKSTSDMPGEESPTEEDSTITWRLQD